MPAFCNCGVDSLGCGDALPATATLAADELLRLATANVSTASTGEQARRLNGQRRCWPG